MTETMFPNAERAIRKLRAETDFPEPKTALKKRDAARVFEDLRVSLGTLWVLAGG